MGSQHAALSGYVSVRVCVCVLAGEGAGAQDNSCVP